MKGYLGQIFIGICIVLAAALIANAASFDQVMSIVWSILWGAVMFVGVAVILFILITILVVVVNK
jgi:hypothetical protein